MLGIDPTFLADLRTAWLGCPLAEREAFARSLSPGAVSVLRHDWPCWARAGQLPPEGDWFVWLIRGGRGSGKTRPGAEWLRRRALDNPGAELLIAGRTGADVRDFMLYGPSGLMKIGHPSERPQFRKNDAMLVWPNGSRALIRVGEQPEGFRGGNLSGAWCDELPAWQYPREAYDNLLLSLREGDDPRVVVTTTLRPIPLMREIIASPSTAMSPVMTTYENAANLAPTFLTMIRDRYEGTRVGRQEIHGELLSDTPGALWRIATLDDTRVIGPDATLKTQLPRMKRVVVGVDPSVSAKGDADECGIVVAGLGYDGRYYVLADYSGGMTPLEWATATFKAARECNADCIVAEVNQGGDLVRVNLDTVRPRMKAAPAWQAPPLKMVHAARGKEARAEPVSSLYEQGRCSHVGVFAKLEDEMTTWVPGGKSPNRVDALVWAFAELVAGASAWKATIIEPARGDRWDDHLTGIG